MTRRREDPQQLGELLNGVAGRLRRVDLRLMDRVQPLWDGAVDDVIRERCRPLFIRDGILVVAVPSGADAQRVRQDATAILASFASLGDDAPRAIRTSLQT